MSISGTHLNPAVRLSLLAADCVALPRTPPFLIVQLLVAQSVCVLTSMLGIRVEFGSVSGGAPDVVGAHCVEFISMVIILLLVFQTALELEREYGSLPRLAKVFIRLAVLACARR